ncbi:hypothetical protein [Acinetobacter sp. TUM15509]|uniref:hypothetical protein n=1 Tax=Acinetobacter sp. TUM15509 TaxID=2609154 RepID=UPI00148F0DCA|nr:hypothetical protein [Acinetobacter sp. TUM15509]
MSISELLEDKFEDELLKFLNQFQEDNDCKIKEWSFTPDIDNNYTLRVEVEREGQNLLS